MLLLCIIRPFQASNQTQSTLFVIYFGNDTTPSIEYTKPNLPKATNSNGSAKLHLLERLHGVSSLQRLFNIHQFRPDRTVSFPLRRHGHPIVRHGDPKLRFWSLCANKVCSHGDFVLRRPANESPDTSNS
jgi:hypothetical protein